MGYAQMTWQPYLVQFQCDHCMRLIPKSEPIRFVPKEGGRGVYHFCITKPCHQEFLTAQELEYVACIGGEYD